MSRAEMIVGTYPCWIQDKPDAPVAYLEPKTSGSRPHNLVNLTFRVTDQARRSRIRAMFDELSGMG